MRDFVNNLLLILTFLLCIFLVHLAVWFIQDGSILAALSCSVLFIFGLWSATNGLMDLNDHKK